MVFDFKMCGLDLVDTMYGREVSTGETFFHDIFNRFMGQRGVHFWGTAGKKNTRECIRKKWMCI